MARPGKQPLYRHCGVALLRSAAMPTHVVPPQWPELADATDCRQWLQSMWSKSWLVDAIRVASPGLARCIDDICARHDVPAKQVRRATISVIRYVLRATGRHTPFGLFAGVTSATVGSTGKVRLGDDHQATARIDGQWLADVVDRLEADPDLLDRLDVAFTNLATDRGDRLEAPRGPDRVSIRYTSAVEYVREVAVSPIMFGVLVDGLVDRFPGVGPSTARSLLTRLVQQGFLITSLRAPLTVTDPLVYVIDRLNSGGAAVSGVGPLLRELVSIRDELDRHNQATTTKVERAHIRAGLAGRTRNLSTAGRTSLAVDVRLDAEVQLPENVAREVERAADALIRLSRQPTGEAVWRDYFTAFCERYGTGTLVPLTDVVHPDAGLGLPHGYPGSTLPAPVATGSSERDESLLALAWQAMAEGNQEIGLSDDLIDSLTVGDSDIQRSVPPHVEVAARIHAASTAALDRGEYTITVAPARSIGTLTGRFTGVAADSGLPDLYEAAPTTAEGAVAVQLSFPPQYPHAENICRIPAYLPHVLSLSEHRRFDEPGISLDDLAITATSVPAGLQLVSLSRRQVLEPQVFHALALDKQSPPLARFLAHLSRGLSTAWHEFDWGPGARRLPYLPRVQYRRSVLSPARWRLTADDLPNNSKVDDSSWRNALEQWRRRWQCPPSIELRDADRSLPLSLTAPAHAQIVRAHLRRYGHATLTETARHEELGWIDGRAHDIVLPLLATREATTMPSTPALRHRPVVTNRTHGQLPGSPNTSWLYAKLYTPPDRMDELIAEHLPKLFNDVRDANSETNYWFIRYRSLRETDHLRLRIRIENSKQHRDYLAAVGAWAQQLRRDQLIGRLTFDTYHPEVGRYGNDKTMAAAEDVFVADSHAVAAQLRQRPTTQIDPQALAALNLLGIAQGFLGGVEAATRWLIKQPASAVAVDRSVTSDTLDFVRHDRLGAALGWDGDVAHVWQARARALARYRPRLPVDEIDAVLEALLHMHHNRALGIDRDSEAICRRLARQIALAWTARLDREQQ